MELEEEYDINQHSEQSIEHLDDEPDQEEIKNSEKDHVDLPLPKPDSEMPKKNLNKYITNVKESLADSLKKSQKQRFNHMYNEVLHKIDSEKKWDRINHMNNQVLSQHHISPSKKLTNGDVNSILDYDFLKSPSKTRNNKQMRHAKSQLSPSKLMRVKEMSHLLEV